MFKQLTVGEFACNECGKTERVEREEGVKVYEHIPAGWVKVGSGTAVYEPVLCSKKCLEQHAKAVGKQAEERVLAEARTHE